VLGIGKGLRQGGRASEQQRTDGFRSRSASIQESQQEIRITSKTCGGLDGSGFDGPPGLSACEEPHRWSDR
jgi:hypothetical protein